MGEMDGKDYRKSLEPLQGELNVMHRWVQATGQRVVVLHYTPRGSRAHLPATVAGLPTRIVGDMADAVRWLAAQARAGDCVLLSPACASLDMYRNYAHRAEAFVAAVKSLEAAAC